MVKIVSWHVGEIPVTARIGGVSSLVKKFFLGSKLADSCSLSETKRRMSYRRPPEVTVSHRYGRLKIGKTTLFPP